MVRGLARAGRFVPSEGGKLGVSIARVLDLNANTANTTGFRVMLLSARTFPPLEMTPRPGPRVFALLPGASLPPSPPHPAGESGSGNNRHFIHLTQGGQLFKPSFPGKCRRAILWPQNCAVHGDLSVRLVVPAGGLLVSAQGGPPS